MEAMWVELLKQAPQVGVLCFLVVVFLRHMDKRDQDHGSERQAMRMSMDNNTSAMNENTKSISLLIQAIKKD